jgi:tetratricopeptide (TPR) repeat protein
MKVVSTVSLCLFLNTAIGKIALAVNHSVGNSFEEIGDAHYRKRENISEAYLALTAYTQFLKHNPKSVEALWKVSMACHYLGMKTSQDEEKEKLFSRGIEAGEKSIELGPECAPCHFWLGINQALYGESVGIIKMLRTLSTVEGHLKKTSELDPTYAEGGSYRILGIINQKVPGILGGSRSEAIKYFEKAITAVPREPMNYLFLAKLLAEEGDDLEKAVSTTTVGLKFPIPPEDHVESREARVELEQLNQELKKKLEQNMTS